MTEMMMIIIMIFYLHVLLLLLHTGTQEGDLLETAE